MIKIILLAFSLGTFLSHLDAEVLPSQDDPGSNAEPNGEQQIPLVSTWLKAAKDKNSAAIRTLNKTDCPQDLKTRLDLVKNELDQVVTTSVESSWLDLRRVLRKEASALQSMLMKYKTVEEGSCKTNLLVAIYHSVDVCFDIVKALTTLKSDPVLISRVPYITLKLLEISRQSTQPGKTELPNSMAELAALVLQLTESLSAESQELSKTES